MLSALSCFCETIFAYNRVDRGTFQSDGSVRDTQAAINAAPAGSVVQLPNGSYTWRSGITINNGIWLRGQSEAGVTLNNDSGAETLITIRESPVQMTQVSFLRVIDAGGHGIHLTVVGSNGGKPVLLHNCYFETKGAGVYRSIEWQTNGGVIWNCQFYSNAQDNSGIAFKAPSESKSWTTNSTLGLEDASGTKNTYVEDCSFKDLFLQAIDFDDNSRTVVRHCVFDNSAITSHGQDTSLAGTRHWEVYQNNFIFTASGGKYPLNLNYFFYIRGGTGIISGNRIPDIKSQMWGDKSEILMTVFNIRRRGNQIPCQTKYPAARQIGQSFRNGGPGTEPVYIWGNYGGGNFNNPGIVDWQPDECGQGQLAADYLKRGRDYFTETERPGYSPYPYPHPLRQKTFSNSVPGTERNASGRSRTGHSERQRRDQ